MNALVRPSACAHDCPSTCALEVEVLDGHTIGRIRGAKDNDYTAGVICAKVARYAEREHHAQRLLHPLQPVGEKGSGQFRQIRWDDALQPDDTKPLGSGDGGTVVLGNKRGEVRLHAKLFDGVRRGGLIAESIWPNSAYEDGYGVNTLTGSDPIAPYGGAAFHDNKVWVRKARAG
jgi:anaerobic selenocysteine-containing dehydrogenase